MKVRLAKSAGFCMGVRRALELVMAEANRMQGPIYTIGPLIHNRQVMDLLGSKGVNIVEDASGLESGTLVIRAHGIPPDQRRQLKSTGLHLVDATCPRVARVQALIRYHTSKGYTALIVGDADHPEVIGLVGYGNGKTFVIRKPEDISDLPEIEKPLVVAQTTQDRENYQRIADEVRKRFPKALVFQTICEATESRQEEVRALATQVDGMVVVGGHHSGNTRRLAQIAEAAGLPTFHVETERDLDRERLYKMDSIGVTAGASTPNWMIKSVVKEIEAVWSRKETLLSRWIRQAFKFLFLTNFVVALGAFSLSYCATILSGSKNDIINPFIAFFYVHSMHVLNRFLDKGASTYNDPELAGFYRRHRPFLILSGIISILGALALSYPLGPPVFLVVAGLSALGIIYSIPLVRSRGKRLRYSRLKDIPGSKTLAEALAWATVITLLPLLEADRSFSLPVVVSFCFVFSMAYVRSAIFDIFQAQGDLIVGVESLPITLGEARTLSLLKGVILFSALILLSAGLLTTVGPFSFLLLLPLFSLSLSLLAYEKRWLYPETALEALVEGTFLMTGLLGLFWNLLR